MLAHPGLACIVMRRHVFVDSNGFTFVELVAVGVGVGTASGSLGRGVCLKESKGPEKMFSEFLLSALGWAVLFGVFPMDAVVFSGDFGMGAVAGIRVDRSILRVQAFAKNNFACIFLAAGG